MVKLRVFILATVSAVIASMAGYSIGDKQGRQIGSEQQAQLSERIAVERIKVIEQANADKLAKTMAALAELRQQSAEEATKAASAVSVLQRQITERIAADKAATLYTASEQELTADTERLRAANGLVLPRRFYVLAGQTVGIYWKDIVPVVDPETFDYEVTCTCDFAATERRRVALAPAVDARGQYKLDIEVADTKGVAIYRQSLEIIVVPSDAGQSKSIKMLLVGDSLGHQSRFPNELAELFGEPGNPHVTFLGSHRPAGSMVSHEQYGGWTFNSFLTNFNLDPKIYHSDRSPFVFGVTDGKPVVDVRRYLDETLRGERPDNVHIQLGINDAFLLDPSVPDLDQKLQSIIANADLLIANLRNALPDAVITVGSVIQANASSRAFVESYREAPQLHNEWRWRQVQMRLAKLMITHFETSSNPGVFLVPTHMVVDPLDGYHAHVWTPEGVEYTLSNAVHPSHVGDKQLAEAIYAVVKAELAGALNSD